MAVVTGYLEKISNQAVEYITSDLQYFVLSRPAFSMLRFRLTRFVTNKNLS